jgi:predicted DCC family thiol-disulfide oxidoreductase YuxK
VIPRGFAFHRARAGAALLAVALAGLGGPVPAAPAVPPPASVDPIYIPAGVSDQAGAVGCIATPEGGAVAVDLASGRTLWDSKAPARALLITGGRTFVLEERAGEGLRVAARTTRDGREVRTYKLSPLPLPSWASLGGARDGRLWTEFDVAARIAKDTLELTYEVTRRQVSGTANQTVIGRVQGVIKVALPTGRVEVKSGPGAPPPPISEAAPPVPGVRLVSFHARAADSRLMRAGPPADAGSALIDGERRFAFEIGRDNRTVIVHRWSTTGARESSLRLDHGRPTDAIWATLDRHHVLLRRADDQKIYDLYSLQTGQAGAQLEQPTDAAVRGPRVFWTTSERKGRLELVAMDAKSGRKLWRRAVGPEAAPLEAPIP